jgi:hypothetical protein
MASLHAYDPKISKEIYLISMINNIVKHLAVIIKLVKKNRCFLQGPEFQPVPT